MSRYVPRLVKILEHEHPEYTGRIRHAILDAELNCVIVCGLAVDDDSPRSMDPTFRDELLKDMQLNRGTMAQYFLGEGRKDWVPDYMVEFVEPSAESPSKFSLIVDG